MRVDECNLGQPINDQVFEAYHHVFAGHELNNYALLLAIRFLTIRL